MRKLTGRAARRLIVGAALLGSFAGSASSAAAQDALMSSGSGVARGSYLLTAYPVLIPQDDNEAGFFLRGAYGPIERTALRLSLGFYNDLTYLGAAGERQLPRIGPLDLSLSLGVHYSAFEDGSADILGLDLSLVGRRALAARSALYGGFDLDFERPEAPFDAFTRARFVAGVETRLPGRMRLLVEGGLGFNDRSPDYLSVGLALRLR
jgi:hypothetical protein